LINKNEILEFARAYRLDANIVEKDYVIGWVLAGISLRPELRESWIFKGGTCLKKCFLETYRFSEDLDFTLLNPDHLQADFLIKAFSAVALWVYDQTGIEIPEDRIRFDVYQSARGKPAGEGRLYYRGPMGRHGDLPRIKLDLTIDEVVVLKPGSREIFHPYSDKPQGSLFALCYSLTELFAEKIRALAERLRPRDLYDVVFLSRLDSLEIDNNLLRDVLEKKCAFKDLRIPTLASLEKNPSRAELEAEWGNMLSHQLPFLPPFEEYWGDLPRVFDMISGIPAGPPRAGTPIGADIDITWRPPRTFADMIPSNWLEIVRFSASNRLCVNLRYGGTQRIIEPYSLRRTKHGDILLFGVKHQTGEIRAYRLDRIEGAEPTNISFAPRFAIELTAINPAPLISRAKTPSKAASTWPKRSSRRSPHQIARVGPRYHGPRYIYRCPICQKKFAKKTNDSKLNRHKGQDGMECPGRTGYLEGVKSP
jgi:predicted nucleotidyltransferase component of viral defense system